MNLKSKISAPDLCFLSEEQRRVFYWAVKSFNANVTVEILTLLRDIVELRMKLSEHALKLLDAEYVMRAIDKQVESGALSSRSPVADARLSFSEPYKYRDWKPTPENINALPEPIFKYVHDLEMLYDPAGMVAENTLLKDQVQQLAAYVAELEGK